jgi:presenilin-like A22 family membrane protease
MKHNLKITLVLLAMFLAAQFIGLYVINFYNSPEVELPLGMEPPEKPETTGEYYGFLSSIIIAFVFAIILFFLLSRFKISFVLKLWFFAVVGIALTIALNAFFYKFNQAIYLALSIGFLFSFLKMYRTNFIIHNLTELLIYPGIAAVFVPLLNPWMILILLVLISFYDMWAVWHSGIMQKMAKYQMDKLKIFAGFFVPYADKKQREKIKKIKMLSKAKQKGKKIKISMAILGGGDVVFPIITAGVMMINFGLSFALFSIFGAFFGLGFLFFLAEKKKFYPAMPFITSGILLGLLAAWLIL